MNGDTGTLRRVAREKGREWGRRYLPAECVGILFTVAGGLAAHLAFDSPLLTALGGTWGETVGYYATMLGTEIARGRVAGAVSAIVVLRTARDLAIEFTGAEVLDTLVIRPAAIYALTTWSGNPLAGLVLGKLVADVAFYIPTIAAYEWRRKHLR